MKEFEYIVEFEKAPAFLFYMDKLSNETFSPINKAAAAHAQRLTNWSVDCGKCTGLWRIDKKGTHAMIHPETKKHVFCVKVPLIYS